MPVDRGREFGSLQKYGKRKVVRRYVLPNEQINMGDTGLLGGIRYLPEQAKHAEIGSESFATRSPIELYTEQVFLEERSEMLRN